MMTPVLVVTESTRRRFVSTLPSGKQAVSVQRVDAVLRGLVPGVADSDRDDLAARALLALGVE
jgi:hypothetical protein